MPRKFLALFLVFSSVSSTAFAQATEAAPMLPAVKSDATSEKVIKIARRENKLRRGHDAEFAFLLSPPSTDCLECVPTLLQEGDRPLLISLQLDPAQGFSYRYPNGSNGKFQKTTAGKMIRTKGGSAALVKVRADKKLPLGVYTLKAKAELRVFHTGNAPVVKQIDFDIPIELVDRDAVAAAGAWPYEIPPNHHVREALLEFIMVPLYLPLILVWIIVCSTGHDCSE